MEKPVADDDRAAHVQHLVVEILGILLEDVQKTHADTDADVQAVVDRVFVAHHHAGVEIAQRGGEGHVDRLTALFDDHLHLVRFTARITLRGQCLELRLQVVGKGVPKIRSTKR